MTPRLLADFLTVVCFMTVGAWLESIGEKRDLFDRFLTPFPLVLSALVFVFLERWIP